MTKTAWRYEIKYGPEGEANYAWVYDADGEMVCTTKTHHAEAIVSRVNATTALEGDAVERVARIVDPEAFEDDRLTWENRRVRALNRARAVLATGLVPDEAAIRADEREKCAKVAESEYADKNWHAMYRHASDVIAAAIRSNGRGA